MRKLISICLFAWALAHVTAAYGQSTTNYALSFNGVNQYVNVPNFGAIIPTNEVTVEFWANVSGGFVQSAFMLQPDQGTNRFQCHPVYTDGVLYWDFGNILADGRIAALAPPGVIGNWVHFALVASQSGNYMRIFINGSPYASTTAMTPFVRGNYDLDIGGNTNFYLHGLLDDFRVWNVALSQTQIQSNMNTVLTGSEPNLLLYYRFDEGSGTVASNSATATGAAYNGTLVNGPLWTVSGATISPYAPVVTTQNPVNVTGTNATLTASVNPEGGTTTCYFEYGTTTNYGSFSATNTIPATNVALNVSIAVSGLTPASLYHYRAVAANTLGTNFANDISFSTPSFFSPVTPPGARIAQQSISNTISNAGQSNVYTLNLAAGQNLSVVVTPAPGLWPSIQLTDPFGATFGFADSVGAGQPALLNNSAILVGGTYSLSVSGINGTTGSYSFNTVLNAALEAESYLDEPNNDLFDAENLAPGAYPAGSLNGMQMAVIGNLAGRPSLRWPDPADVYRFFLYQGETATLVANNLNPGQVQLALMNGRGQTLALGSPTAINVSQFIDSFVAPSSDYCYAVVTGSSNVEYSLVVTRDAEFQLEPNQSPAEAQFLYGFQTLIGHLESNAGDYYYISANVGDQLSFATATPVSGPTEIINVLNPALFLYDLNGDLVSQAFRNAPDGHNAFLSVTVPNGAAGLWMIEVASLDGSLGDYQLTAKGATGGNPNPFAVTGIVPSPGAYVAPPAAITIQFNQQIYGPSLSAGELTVNNVPATAVALTGPYSATWTVPAGAIPPGTNAANVVILGNASAGQQVTSLNGTPVIPFSYTFFTSTNFTTPTAAPDVITDMENTLTNIPVSLLLGNDSSPIGGPLSITGVNSTSGATLVLTNGGSTIAYTPPPGYAGVDSFNYTLSDGHLTAIGQVTVYVTRTGAPPFGHIAISGTPSDLLFSFSGIPGQQYALMSATSATGPWVEIYPVQVTDMTGFAQYTNITSTPPPTQFFRVQSLPW